MKLWRYLDALAAFVVGVPLLLILALVFWRDFDELENRG